MNMFCDDTFEAIIRDAMEGKADFFTLVARCEEAAYYVPRFYVRVSNATPTCDDTLWDNDYPDYESADDHYWEALRTAPDTYLPGIKVTLYEILGRDEPLCEIRHDFYPAD